MHPLLLLVSILNNLSVIKISIAFIYQGAIRTFCLLETQSIDNQNASREENELTAGMRDSNWICLNALSSGSRLLLDLRTWSFPEFMNMTKNILLLYLSVMCLKMTNRFIWQIIEQYVLSFYKYIDDMFYGLSICAQMHT